MGGTITLVPDGFVSSLTRGWVVVGGGTLNSAVADANDATYITDTTPGVGSTRITWTLATSALPAGSAVKYIYCNVRNSQPTGNRQLTMSIGTYNPPDGISYQSPGKVWTPVAGIADTPGTAAGTVPQARSQGVVDLLIVSVLQYPSGAFAEDHRIYRVEGKVVYVDSPTATSPALFPASANTLTTKPGLTWNFNSTDGFSQYEYRVALWKLSNVTAYPGGRSAFEAAVETVFSPTGYGGSGIPVWTSGGWVQSSANNITPDKDVDGSSAYVYYVQVSALHSNARLSHPTSMGVLDFTQAITIPTVPTSVTPTWVGATSWIGSISVVYPTQTLGAWTGRRLIVQARDSGSTSEAAWRTLPQGTAEIGAGSGTVVFSDPLIYAGQSKTYRVKTLLYSTSTGYSSGSAWVTSSNITGVYDRFVLRDPYDALSATECRILGDLEAQVEEIQGSFRPLGSPYPVVVSDTILGRRWNVEVLVKTALLATKLDQLRETLDTLVLHSDMAFKWYWVRIGPQVQKRMIRQPGRVTEGTRSEIWQMELIEVSAPVNQPPAGV
jgi:hypothetical protein